MCRTTIFSPVARLSENFGFRRANFGFENTSMVSSSIEMWRPLFYPSTVVFYYLLKTTYYLHNATHPTFIRHNNKNKPRDYPWLDRDFIRRRCIALLFVAMFCVRPFFSRLFCMTVRRSGHQHLPAQLPPSLLVLVDDLHIEFVANLDNIGRLVHTLHVKL